MRRLWEDIRSHRGSALGFLLCWLVVWVVTVVTWRYDATGRSTGMAPPVLLLHLGLPLLAAVFVGAWRARDRAAEGGLGTAASSGAIAGALVSLLDLALVAGWDQLLHVLGRVAPPAPGAARPPAWTGWAEVLEIAVAFGMIGLVLGFTGALLARTVAGRLRRPTTEGALPSGRRRG
jgi:hypothetical protein